MAQDISSRLNSNLSDEHLAMLLDESAISDKVILSRGYHTVRNKTEASNFDLAGNQQQFPSLLIPVNTVDGNIVYVTRPDKRLNGRPKYEWPKNVSLRLDVHPDCMANLSDPAIDLYITEGSKKADCIISRGGCAVSINGVYGFSAGKNGNGDLALLPDFDAIELQNRRVYIAFDSDAQDNKQISTARSRLAKSLRARGAVVKYIYLEDSADGHKVGVDDWFAADSGRTLDDLNRLTKKAQANKTPGAKASAPQIELLDKAPATISRPLSLIDGRGYVATWLWAKVTVNESIDKRGKKVTHNPPLIEHEERTFVVRDDGVIFGDGGDYPLDELGLVINLPEKVPESRRLSKSGLINYRTDQLPSPAIIFQRICECIDRFIDFDRSFGSQKIMVEMVACFAMATWFLDAFTVAGNLWPNGDRGSGKTQLLIVICELSYLGQVILAGGSFAALRDLADYGATLAFDDAENLTDPRKTDPDKRTLLLAGNRRGNTVPLKEKDGDKGWRTRYVNTFSFRLFSAIRLPDNVLASRTIIVPLIRTPDRYRANADPLDKSLWPHDRNQLKDDLYCLALKHLPEFPAYEAIVNQEASLTGRNLEPWRALLAVARWLDDQGVSGLWGRMEQLSMDYQQERPNMEISDLTSLAIRTICHVVGEKIQTERGVSDVDDVSDIYREKHFCLTAKFTEVAKKILEDLELDINADQLTSRRIGRTLGKMRLQKGRQQGTGKNGWRVSLADMQRWCISYGLDLSELSGLTISIQTEKFTNPPNITNFTELDSDLIGGVI